MARDWELRHEAEEGRKEWERISPEGVYAAKEREARIDYAKRLAAAEQFGFDLSAGDPNALEDYRRAVVEYWYGEERNGGHAPNVSIELSPADVMALREGF